MGISGNEKADIAAKSALSLSVTPMKIPATDLVPCVTKLISDRKVATVLEQLHRKQVTSYQANCRWPSTEIAPASSG